MKKVILVVVLLIAVAAIGLPPVIGGMTESSLRAHIEQMDENPMVAMRVANYERGWMAGHAAVEIGLDERYSEMILAGAAGGDVDEEEMAAMMREQSITVEVDIAHGPIIFMDGLHFGLSRLHAVLDDRDELAAMAMQELGIDYVAELRGQVSYTGTFSFSSNVPPIEYADESGQLSFSGVQLDGTARGRNLQLDGVLESISVDSAGTAFTARDAWLRSDSDRVNLWLWTGDFEGGVDSVTVVDTLGGAGGAMEMSGLRVSGDADLDPPGELIEGSITYAFDTVRIPAEDIEVLDAEVTVGIENLSVQAMTQYYETALNIDPRNPDATAAAMQSSLMRMLERNPAVSLDPIRFTLNGESLNASINARTVNGDQIDLDMFNPMLMLGMFEVSANIDASKTLIHDLAAQATAAQMAMMDPAQLPPGQSVEEMAAAQTDVMIISLLGQGFIIDDGENYSSNIEYANAEVRVNGNPVPIFDLLQ